MFTDVVAILVHRTLDAEQAMLLRSLSVDAPEVCQDVVACGVGQVVQQILERTYSGQVPKVCLIPAKAQEVEGRAT